LARTPEIGQTPPDFALTGIELTGIELTGEGLASHDQLARKHGLQVAAPKAG
jgi:hypothetical protein